MYSRFNRPATVPAPCGSGVTSVYEERIDNTGRSVLVKTGERDHNAFVQASLEATKVYNILERFNAGDTSVLSRVKGFFADVTAIPKNFVEVHNFMKSLETNFDSLPAELKSRFGNSHLAFMEAINDGSIQKIFAELNKDSAANS